MSLKTSSDSSRMGLKQSDFSTFFTQSKDFGSKQIIKEDESIQESFISIQEKESMWTNFQNKFKFSFGSFTLALVYMANTMVIPDMNQVQVDISFGTKKSFFISFSMYFIELMVICLPITLAIKLCKELNCPIFTQIISKITSPFLAKLFVYSNIAFNILSLLDFVVDLMLAASICIPILRNLSEDSPVTYQISFYFAGLLIFYLFYRISHFENFHDIQFRLVLSLICKWALMWAIFIIVKMEGSCSNLIIDPTYNELKRSFFGFMNYCFFIYRCLSFPFLEIYHVKREVKNNYENVQRAYFGQLFLRSLFFFQQVLFWGLLYLLNEMNTLNCFYTQKVQSIMLVLRLVCAISIVPIYAHNFSLNMTILNGTWLEATKEDNEKQVKTGFLVVGVGFTAIMTALILVLQLSRNNYIDEILLFIESTSTLCFGFACIAVPSYVYLRYVFTWRKSSSVFYIWGSKLVFLIIMIYFLILFISPGVERFKY